MSPLAAVLQSRDAERMRRLSETEGGCCPARQQVPQAGQICVPMTAGRRPAGGAHDDAARLKCTVVTSLVELVERWNEPPAHVPPFHRVHEGKRHNAFFHGVSTMENSGARAYGEKRGRRRSSSLGKGEVGRLHFLCLSTNASSDGVPQASSVLLQRPRHGKRKSPSSSVKRANVIFPDAWNPDRSRILRA